MRPHTDSMENESQADERNRKMTHQHHIDEVLIRQIEDQIQPGDAAQAELKRLDHEEPGLGRVLRDTIQELQTYLESTGAPDQVMKWMTDCTQVALARILVSIRSGWIREWEARSEVKVDDEGKHE